MPRKITTWVVLSVLLLLTAASVNGQTEIVVTPTNPQGWAIANQRADSTVEITPTQPRAGNGSLEFVTNFVTSGQDKVDYEFSWDPAVETGRTLANLSQLAFEYYRDSATSTVSASLHPALRVGWYHDGGTSLDLTDDSWGSLIYEEVYQGVNPVPVDSWDSNVIDFSNDNFWAFCSNCGGSSGVVQNFNTSLQDWQVGQITGQPGDPTPPDMSIGNTYIFSINVGVGSGWSNDVLMWVDQVRIGFSAQDDFIYNFEIDSNPPLVATAISTIGQIGRGILILSMLVMFLLVGRHSYST